MIPKLRLDRPGSIALAASSVAIAGAVSSTFLWIAVGGLCAGFGLAAGVTLYRELAARLRGDRWRVLVGRAHRRWRERRRAWLVTMRARRSARRSSQ